MTYNLLKPTGLAQALSYARAVHANIRRQRPLFAVASTVIALSACSTLNKTPEQTTPSPVAVQTEEPQTYRTFSTDTLYSLIVAELAATRRQYDLTLENYIKEAIATNDLGVIARAARLAQYFRNHDQTLAMGKLWVAKQPNDTEANAIVATAYIEKRQPLQALGYAERILSQIEPSNNEEAQEEANKRAAITETIANYSRDVDSLTKQALIERYNTLIQSYPQYAAILVGLSILHEAQGDTASAYRIIEQAIAQDKDYLPALMQEIRLLQASDQNDKAIAKLKSVLEKQPENNRLRLLYARMLTQTDINAAYKEFSELAEESPQHLDIQFSKALIALEIKKVDESKGILEMLLNKGYRLNTVNFYLGNLAEADNNLEKALKHYLDVSGGEDYIASHSRAARIMAKQGNIKEARVHFTELRRESPDKQAQLYAAEGEVLQQVGQVTEAIKVLTQAINQFPDNTGLRYSRSSLYEQTDQLDLMESDLRHALSIEPENASTLNALGYFLTSRTNRHQEALGFIEKALKLKPNDPAIMDSMGWALFNLGRTDEAIEYLRKALELFPDPEVAAHLGEALWVKGNKQEARSIWNNNLKENPNDSRIIDTMERLQVSPTP